MSKEVCEGNVFTPVCHSVHGGGCLPQCMLGYTHTLADTPLEQTPPWADPPGADTPRSRHPPTRTLGSRHPLGADTPCAVHAVRHGQQADGTHPTGMHTC